MDSDSRTVDQDEGREEDRGSILRRIEEKLDREYADYCRDRQARFDRDFEAWRQKRSGPPAPVEEPARNESGGEDEAKRR